MIHMSLLKHITIIDDEESIITTLSLVLQSEGYRTSIFKTGSDAIENIWDDLPDLIILDIIMPGIDGITFCHQFRKKNSSIPIIFLSSRVEEFTKLEALEKGGDDYLTKPYSLKELLVRISVCLRRVRNYVNIDINRAIETDDFCIDELGYQVYYNQELINFSVTEFRIFKTLYNNQGVVYSRDDLMIKAYPEDNFISDRNIDTHITRIRKKITKIFSTFEEIESVYGLGYKFKKNSI